MEISKIVRTADNFFDGMTAFAGVYVYSQTCCSGHLSTAATCLQRPLKFLTFQNIFTVTAFYTAATSLQRPLLFTPNGDCWQKNTPTLISNILISPCGSGRLLHAIAHQKVPRQRSPSLCFGNQHQYGHYPLHHQMSQISYPNKPRTIILRVGLSEHVVYSISGQDGSLCAGLL